MTAESRATDQFSSREIEILRATYRTMARSGSHRMSLREIADDAGVSKPLLLYHFGSKDNLLMAVMKWVLERTEKRIRQGVEKASHASEQMAALVDAVFVAPDANRDFYLFYLDLVEHAVRDPRFESLSAMLDSIINGLYAEVVAAGIEEGVFDVGDPIVAARDMRAIIEGTFLQWMQTDDWRDSHDAWKEQCREALLRLLGTAAE
ncbi:MAG: TetR/AcrR family transcriptional regulator [Acidimicrobiia bacterium]|jgi:AcrR family transcriptional regulator